MRLRSPFRPAPNVTDAAPRARRGGVVAPVAIAVALAVAGHEVSATVTPVRATATAMGFGVAQGVELPDFSPVRRVVDGAADTRASVVRKEPKKKAPKKRVRRASRSTARKPIAKPKWVRPSGGPLTSRYGPRWGRMHRGLDFGASYGSPIYAATSGVVSFAGPEGGYGRLVTIRHAGGVTTAYGHMSRFVVRRGQRVKAGQVIAYVGSAGRSTGPHLHFEVRVGSSYINPLPFLRARKVWI
ncbi:MAG TPA: M23 family metallopeptidase [Frankiaceae bacterium]|nr:M23 family metallopeptidase [Frankiaceae bacterium]